MTKLLHLDFAQKLLDAILDHHKGIVILDGIAEVLVDCDHQLFFFPRPVLGVKQE